MLYYPSFLIFCFDLQSLCSFFLVYSRDLYLLCLFNFYLLFFISYFDVIIIFLDEFIIYLFRMWWAFMFVWTHVICDLIICYFTFHSLFYYILTNAMVLLFCFGFFYQFLLYFIDFLELLTCNSWFISPFSSTLLIISALLASCSVCFLWISCFSLATRISDSSVLWFLELFGFALFCLSIYYFFCVTTPAFVSVLFKYFCQILFLCRHKAAIFYHSFLFSCSHTFVTFFSFLTSLCS